MFIEMVSENHVTVLCLPLYCSYRLQPLDVSFPSSPNVFYTQEKGKYFRNNPGTVVTQLVRKLFGGAYTRASTSPSAFKEFTNVEHSSLI